MTCKGQGSKGQVGLSLTKNACFMASVSFLKPITNIIAHQILQTCKLHILQMFFVWIYNNRSRRIFKRYLMDVWSCKLVVRTPSDNLKRIWSDIKICPCTLVSIYFNHRDTNNHPISKTLYHNIAQRRCLKPNIKQMYIVKHKVCLESTGIEKDMRIVNCEI